MSSLDMVAFINSTREPGKPELTNFNFLAKVPTVLADALKFQSTYVDSLGRTQRMYNVPRREAMLMAMS